MPAKTLLCLARHVPLVVLKRDGQVVGVTEAAGHLLGCSETQYTGQLWTDMVTNRVQVSDYLDLCRRSLDPIPGAFCREVDGVERRFRCDGYAAASLSEPNGERFLVLVIRRLEPYDRFVLLGQKVEELNSEILRRRAREHELAEAIAAAQNADRAKDEFLAMLGHELRNPLAPILTALELVRMRGEVRRKEDDVIERQVHHLVRLVDDLLDISRIARGKIELKSELIEVADVVAKAIEMVGPLIERRRHTLSVSVPATGLAVHGDPARLAQVVSNLLHNAAKYSEPGAPIWISARAEGADIVITVRDRGMGIAPEMLPRVFDQFAQERQALDRAQGGLGLGLAIVKNLVERHGGTVEAHSAGRGKGAELVIRLPAAHVTDAVVEPRPVPSPPVLGPGAKRVLVVDDNEEAAELLSEALLASGHITRVAYDGPSALRIARELRPEVALLDIGLPVMDGYELAASMRTEPELQDVRLIAVTAYAQDSDRRRTRSAGFEAHVAKPVDLARLNRLISESR